LGFLKTGHDVARSVIRLRIHGILKGSERQNNRAAHNGTAPSRFVSKHERHKVSDCQKRQRKALSFLVIFSFKALKIKRFHLASAVEIQPVPKEPVGYQSAFIFRILLAAIDAPFVTVKHPDVFLSSGKGGESFAASYAKADGANAPSAIAAVAMPGGDRAYRNDGLAILFAVCGTALAP
jgi:hypothetical protein